MRNQQAINLTTAALVLSNLVPLAGVLFYEWVVFELLLLFWCETLILGAINIARYWTLYRQRNHASLLLFIPFFLIHYGGFALAHLVFLVAVFRPDDPATWSLAALGVPLIALTASHVYSYHAHFIGQQEYLHADPKQLMIQPYARVVAMHVAIMIGGGLVLWIDAPTTALIVLVLIKIAFDVEAHRREHRAKAVREESRRDVSAGKPLPRDPVFKDWGSQ